MVAHSILLFDRSEIAAKVWNGFIVLASLVPKRSTKTINRVVYLREGPTPYGLSSMCASAVVRNIGGNFMKKADLGDQIIEYQTLGEGEPIILIDGSVLADAFVPRLNEDPLTSRYQLVHYHRRGYMSTTHSAPPVRIID
jgi:hypothetical protein